MSSFLHAVLVVSVFAVGQGHPGGIKHHSHQRQASSIEKLRENIRTMEVTLSKQEHRLVEGFNSLKKKVGKMEKMATKAENEFLRNKKNQRNCSIPTSPPNGHTLGLTFDTSGNPHLPASGEVYFVCNDGFHLYGSESSTCLQNGTWSGAEAVCVDMRYRIAACVRLNCQNGGSCVRKEEADSYVCECAEGYIGKRCQKRSPAASRNRAVVRALCSSKRNREVCSCPPGYNIGSSRNLCFDDDECADQSRNSPEIIVIPDDVGSMAKRNARARNSLCRHQCVNTPGSYRCVCPPGFTVKQDGSCQDVNECVLGTHNCTSEQTCFNTGGEFKCIQVVCPSKYVHASPFVCQRQACGEGEKKCVKEASSYFFNYIDLPLTMQYPADVFPLVTDQRTPNNTLRFTLLPGLQSDYFSARKTNSRTGVLTLNRPLNGTDGATVDFEIKELTIGKRRRLTAKFIYRMTFFQSRFDF